MKKIGGSGEEEEEEEEDLERDGDAWTDRIASLTSYSAFLPRDLGCVSSSRFTYKSP